MNFKNITNILEQELHDINTILFFFAGKIHESGKMKTEGVFIVS